MSADERRPESGATPPTASASVRRLPAAERRQLTVLFCDLVGSTELSEQLDPEVLHEIVQAYHRCCVTVVQRYQGTIAHFLGDGVVVMFGFPVAHEDDAERAVRCGCDLLQAIGRIPSQPPLQARVGIHTGGVVIGEIAAEDGRSQVLPMSLTSNLASRLQAHADPHSVLISQATMKLVPGLFITRGLAPAVLKGIEKPVPVYQVLHPSGVRTRLEAAGALTPFVGRDAEIARLLQRWQVAQARCGQAVLVVGEPGQGKSRLLLSLRHSLGEASHTWLECRASPLTQSSAFQPLIDLVHRGLALQVEDSDAEKLQRLERAMESIGQIREDAIPLLAPLLNLPLPPAYVTSPTSAAMRRTRTLSLLADWILALAANQPLALAVEDLHWADASTLEVLRLLVERLDQHPILLLMTARPEFSMPWASRARTSTIALGPLAAAPCVQILRSLAGGRTLPESLQQTLLERSNGVPLFLEEVTRQVLESGQLEARDDHYALIGALDHVRVPDTLQDSLMARLDRLQGAREVAQIASVVGREIPYRLIGLLTQRDEQQLDADLATLTGAGLLFQRGVRPDSTFLFKHALIQDAAYGSLLKITRQRLHGEIASALELHFPERAQAEPGLLAEHFEKAGLAGPALRFHRSAAHRAAAKVADKEAIQHAQAALRLLPAVPQDAARDALELDIVVMLARCQINQFGYGSEAAGRNLSRAREVATTVADHAVRFRTTIELFLVNNGLARYAPALQLAEELRAMAQASGHPQEQLGGIVTATMVHLAQGRPARAMELMDEVEPPLDASIALQSLAISPMVHGVVRLIFKSWAEWLLGFPDRAARTCADAMMLAEQCNYAPTLAHTLALGPTFLALRRGEPEKVPALCAQLRDWTGRFGLVLWGSYADLLEGIARCQQDDFDGAIRSVSDCIARRKVIGSRLWQTMFYGMLAEQCVRGGFLDDARDALDAGFEARETYDETLWEAELHRIAGEWQWASSQDADAARSSFDKALKIARHQHARIFELRAATSLARLHIAQGLLHKATQVLEPVYAWFTEGFDTQDLMTASALLESVRSLRPIATQTGPSSLCVIKSSG